MDNKKNKPTNARSLKIEAQRNRWKAVAKPKIRLIGRWLERAGFKPGAHVQVTCVSPGLMELRSADHSPERGGERE